MEKSNVQLVSEWKLDNRIINSRMYFSAQSIQTALDMTNITPSLKSLSEDAGDFIYSYEKDKKQGNPKRLWLSMSGLMKLLMKSRKAKASDFRNDLIEAVDYKMTELIEKNEKFNQLQELSHDSMGIEKAMAMLSVFSATVTKNNKDLETVKKRLDTIEDEVIRVNPSKLNYIEGLLNKVAEAKNSSYNVEVNNLLEKYGIPALKDMTSSDFRQIISEVNAMIRETRDTVKK
jgi:hypothetical protein